MAQIKTYKCSEVISSCKYAGTITSSGLKFCDYLCITEKRRGCDPDKCTRYESNGKPNKHCRQAMYSAVLDSPKTKTKTMLEEEASRLRSHKLEIKKAARDFNYGQEVIDQIEAAESISDVDRIMNTARQKKFK